jgi:hypothetical protein
MFEATRGNAHGPPNPIVGRRGERLAPWLGFLGPLTYCGHARPDPVARRCRSSRIWPAAGCRELPRLRRRKRPTPSAAITTATSVVAWATCELRWDRSPRPRTLRGSITTCSLIFGLRTRGRREHAGWLARRANRRACDRTSALRRARSRRVRSRCRRRRLSGGARAPSTRGAARRTSARRGAAARRHGAARRARPTRRHRQRAARANPTPWIGRRRREHAVAARGRRAHPTASLWPHDYHHSPMRRPYTGLMHMHACTYAHRMHVARKQIFCTYNPIAGTKG